MNTGWILHLAAPDRPGLVGKVSELVRAHDGNWLESRLVHLGGRFGGMAHISLPADQVESFRSAAQQLSTEGMVCWLCAEEKKPAAASKALPRWRIEVVGNDRPGIVQQLSRVLADRGANVEEMFSECMSAPMAGGLILRAWFLITCPDETDGQALQAAIEQVASDLMVDIQLQKSASS